MWVEMVVGILVISFLVFLMGPVFWSSRLSLRDKNLDDKFPKSRP